MKIKRSITFYPERRKINGKVKENDVPVVIRVSFDGQFINTSTGIRTNIKDWDNNQMRIKKSSPSFEFNKVDRLNQLESAIERLFVSSELEENLPDKNEILTSINQVKNPNERNKNTKDLKITEMIEEFYLKESRLNNWSEGTLKKFKTVQNIWREFYPSLEINDFDNSVFTDYVFHLQDKRKYRNTTLKKHVKFLKWFLRWALRNGYSVDPCFEEFKPNIKKAEKKIIFLTQEEQNKIFNHQLPKSKQYLERARDLLEFMCFTGLRYSDVRNLKHSNIKDSSIEITTKKTSDNLKIELNKHSKKILEKYKNLKKSSVCPLPIISNQKLNQYLKELGEVCGLYNEVILTHFKGSKRYDEVFLKYQLLSTHVGRRTFICTALVLGTPPHIVMKWTGHSDYKSMKPYIDVADKQKEEHMQKFDNI